MKDWHDKPEPPKNPFTRKLRAFAFWAEVTVISVLILYTACHAAILALIKFANHIGTRL